VKVRNAAKVLSTIDAGRGPDVVILNEIEIDQTPDASASKAVAWLDSVKNRKLTEILSESPLPPEITSLPAEVLLLKALEDAGLGRYQMAVSDEPPGNHEDGRSLAIRNLVFSRFPITAVRSHPTPNARAILEVTLDVDGYPLTVFQNHWKSGAGDPETEVSRRENAKTLRLLVDGLLKADPNADFIIGGDLNSHYNQKQRYREMRTTGINDILGSQGNGLAIRGKDRDLYNLWFELPSDQRTSEVFDNKWGTLMHLIVARGLYDQNGVQYVDNSFAVLKLRGLNMDAFGRIPAAMAQAARNKENAIIAALFAAGSGYGPTLAADSVALFNSAHANLVDTGSGGVPTLARIDALNILLAGLVFTDSLKNFRGDGSGDAST
jgi:hypothetical protein